MIKIYESKPSLDGGQPNNGETLGRPELMSSMEKEEMIKTRASAEEIRPFIVRPQINAIKVALNYTQSFFLRLVWFVPFSMFFFAKPTGNRVAAFFRSANYTQMLCRVEPPVLTEMLRALEGST